MSKPTLLMTTPYYPPAGGGLERYARNIAQRLQKDHGWRVVVVTSGNHKGPDEIRMDGKIKVYRLGYKHKLSYTTFDFRWRRKVKRIIRIENPALINVHTPVPGLADITSSLAGKRRLVVHYHAGSMKKGNAPVLDALVWLYEHGPMRLMLRSADKIVCSSDFVRLNFLKAWSAKSLTISAAFEPGVFSPAARLTTKPELVFIGGLKTAEAHKGLEQTVQAALALRKTFPAIKLRIIGEGDKQPYFQAMAERASAPHALHFTGLLEPEKVAAQLKRARLFVLPSSNDSLPTTIIEAMASGLPVVTTPVGSIPSLVQDGANGTLIKPGNASALEHAIANILKDTKLANHMRQNNIRAVQQATWQQRADQTQEVFKKLTPLAPGKNIAMLASGSINASLTYRVRILAKELVARGYRVTLIVPSADKYNHFKKEKVTELDGVTIHQPYQFATRQPMINLLPYMFCLAWYLLRTRFDVLYVYKPTPITVVGLVAQKLKATPLLLDMDDLGAEVMRQEGFPTYMYKLVAWCERRIEKAANAFIVSSTYLQKKYKKEWPGKAVLLIPNGVDTSQFSPLPVPKKPTSRVVFYGACNSRQDLDPLFEGIPSVIAAVPKCQFVIVGDGSELSHYKRLVARHNWQKHVTFKGWMQHQDAIKQFRYGDLGYAYKPDTETVRAASLMKVPQYMALGIVPVVSDVGDLAQYVQQGEAGYICKPGDSAALAHTMIDALQHDSLRLKKAKAASERAPAMYNWENLAQQVDTFIAKQYAKRF